MTNANTDNEIQVGLVNSYEECVELVQTSCPDATMANIDFSSSYGSSYIGSCWCQFGDNMKMNDDDCCATTWIEGCDCNLRFS